MQAGSTVHLSLHHNSFKICISSRKIDLSCLGLYPFIFRTDLNGSKEDDGVIIVHFTSIYQLLYCIALYCGRVPAANGPGCTAAEGLFYKPWSLVVPTCTARSCHQRPY